MDKINNKIIFVPIEQLEERYSVQWYKWMMAEFKRQGKDVYVVGDLKPRVIKHGEFLDVIDTQEYKNNQLKEILQLIKNGFEGTIFFMDLWFTGLESIGYIRDCMNLDIKIKGIVHAGTWDKHDFLSQKGLGLWSKGFERSIFKLSHTVYVSTDFHRDIIEEYFGEKFDNIKKIDFHVEYNKDFFNNKDRDSIILFPHRIAKEKNLDDFRLLEKLYNAKYKGVYPHGVRFVVAKEQGFTKEEYYKYMSECKVVFSSAYQETFGIAMIEGLNCGCYPLSPNRLSYVETLEGFERYENIQEAVELLQTILVNNYRPIEPRYINNFKELIKDVTN